MCERKKPKLTFEASQFSLQSIRPPQGGVLASHCTSRLTEGQTLSWYPSIDSGTSFSATTVFESKATMFAVPVNGFNIAASSHAGQQDPTAVATYSTTSATTSQTLPSPHSTSPPESSRTSTLGLSIGVTIGVFLAAFLLVSTVFVLRKGQGKRMRWLRGPLKAMLKMTKRSGPESEPGRYSEETVLVTVPAPYTHVPTELPLNKPRRVHELAAPRWIRELPQG